MKKDAAAERGAPRRPDRREASVLARADQKMNFTIA
jgi:hypothetical protein